MDLSLRCIPARAATLLLIAVTVLAKAQAPYQFEMSPSVKGVLTAGSIEELQSALEPLQAVTSILQTKPHPSSEQLANAVSLSRKALSQIESRSLTLQGDDPLALFWTDVLSDGWFVTGWAALESGDLASAESYLSASWRLSRDKSSGLQLARLLEAKGDKPGAAHVLELASAAEVDNPMGLMGSSFPTSDEIEEDYHRLTGHMLPDSREQLKSLRDELSRQDSIPSLVRPTKLDGNAIFLVTVRPGEPNKAAWYLDDAALAPAAAALAIHDFESVFPSGSKASLVREVYVGCNPSHGCQAYLHSPTNLDFPGSRVNWKVFYPGGPIPYKTANIRLE